MCAASSCTPPPDRERTLCAVNIVLAIAAGCFAFACGVNDGGALVALGLRLPVLRPLTAIVVLSVFVVIAPLLVGTTVASTLAQKLVPFSGPDQQVAVLIAIVASLAVVAVLVHLRVPTSLTLSTIGALVGAGLGFGFPVSWPTVGVVMVAGMVGPLVGAGIALGIMTALRALPVGDGGPRLVRGLHLVGYSAACIAYGANDGQRMLAVFALSAASTPQVETGSWQLAMIAAIFAIGAVPGMYRYSGTLGSDLVPARPHDAAIAELGGAGASFGGVLVGVPLSMTQAITGGIVGSAAMRGWRRVRWTRTSRLIAAWLLTLPSALVVGAMLGAIVHSLS